jgi:single-stranded DNA-binding protein
MGNVSDEPAWKTIDGQQVLCFLLATTEELRKGNKPYEHTELHRIKVPPEMMKNGTHFQKDDQLYIQGKIQTRVVYENEVKLYRTEVLVTSIERLTAENKHMFVA